MKILTKILIWISGIIASNTFKYLFFAISFYVATYWMCVVVYEPFKWLFKW